MRGQGIFFPLVISIFMLIALYQILPLMKTFVDIAVAGVDGITGFLLQLSLPMLVLGVIASNWILNRGRE